MQNKAPQIVDGDHVLKLGKDEIIRRLIQGIVTDDDCAGFPLFAAVMRTVPSFSEKETVQLCTAYGFDPYIRTAYGFDPYK